MFGAPSLNIIGGTDFTQSAGPTQADLLDWASVQPKKLSVENQMWADIGAHHANVERAGGYAKWAAGTALDHSGDFAPNAIAMGLNVFGNWTGLGVSTDVNGSLSVGFISQRQQVLSTLAWAAPELLGATEWLAPRLCGGLVMLGLGRKSELVSKIRSLTMSR